MRYMSRPPHSSPFYHRTILGEEYRSLSSLLCIFSTPLLPRPSQVKIFSSTPYSQTPSAYVPPKCERPSFTPIQNKQNYSSVYLNL
jgi:hypothetical protein